MVERRWVIVGGIGLVAATVAIMLVVTGQFTENGERASGASEPPATKEAPTSPPAAQVVEPVTPATEPPAQPPTEPAPAAHIEANAVTAEPSPAPDTKPTVSVKSTSKRRRPRRTRPRGTKPTPNWDPDALFLKKK